MSAISELVALIGPVMDGRAFRDHAGDKPTPPYVVFFSVSEVEGNTLDENGGTDNESADRIQIDIWALASAERDAKKAAVKAALKSWHVSNVLNLAFDGYETDTKLFRATLDISTIHQ